MKHLLIIFSAVLLLASSCGTEPEDEGNTINPNIVKVKDCCEGLSGDYFMGKMVSDEIIYSINRALVKLFTDTNSNLISATPLGIIPRGDGKPANFIEISEDYSKVLLVKSSYTDVSLGELVEVNLIEEAYRLLRDSTYNISSAVYWNGDDTKLIYYSYGNDQGLEAGYYLHNKTTDIDSLLLAHRAEIGPSEMLNGFDLSPENTKLLYPNVRASFANPDIPQTPQIIEYNLETQQADTFATTFDLSFVRVGLWLRYSPDGSRILYCNFPLGSFTSTTNDDSEVGIIELHSRQKRILDINTNSEGRKRSVQIAPTWSYDGQDIVYGSGELFYPSGAKGFYSLYMIKNVDDPQNYK